MKCHPLFIAWDVTLGADVRRELEKFVQDCLPGRNLGKTPIYLSVIEIGPKNEVEVVRHLQTIEESQYFDVPRLGTETETTRSEMVDIDEAIRRETDKLNYQGIAQCLSPWLLVCLNRPLQTNWATTSKDIETVILDYSVGAELLNRDGLKHVMLSGVPILEKELKELKTRIQNESKREPSTESATSLKPATSSSGSVATSNKVHPSFEPPVERPAIVLDEIARIAPVSQELAQPVVEIEPALEMPVTRELLPLETGTEKQYAWRWLGKKSKRKRPRPRPPIVGIDRSETPSETRSINGPIIIEAASRLNAVEWHTDGYTKLPEYGPAGDFICEIGNIDALRLVAGSMRGTKHKYYGDPNQDSFAISHNDKYLIVAVSDGVSSAKHSAYVSKFLTHSVVNSLKFELLNKSDDLDFNLRDQIQVATERASHLVLNWREGELYAPYEKSEEVGLRDLAATLTVLVITRQHDENGNRNVVVGFVGDSPCYVLDALDWEIKTAETKTGEVLEHGTKALPVASGVPVVLEWAEFAVKPHQVVLVMTDGIGTSLASGRSAVGKWLAPRIPRLRGPNVESVFSEMILFDRQGEDDDRTLAVIFDVDQMGLEAQGNGDLINDQ